MRLTVLVGLVVALFLAGPAEPQDDKGGPIHFSEHLIQGDYGYAFCVSAHDIDGDGNLDLVSADTIKNQLFWFAGDGKGKFTKHVIANEAGWLERHSVGDVNKDGFPDIAIVKNLAAELVWFQHPGKGRADKEWKKHVIATDFKRAYDVRLLDLDGDGDLDAAATGWSGNQIAVFENSGTPEDGKEWKRNVIDKIGEPRTVRQVDFNGDGRPDILSTARSGNMVMWYENPAKPFSDSWKRHVIDDETPSPTHGHPVDMDGDGDMDVVMAVGFISAFPNPKTHQVVWYENVGSPGKGTKWIKHKIGDLRDAFEAFAADLNGDGHKDVVATAWGENGKIVWFENPGDPKKSPWKMHVLKEKWIRANQVIVVDLDKDGRPDIVATAERGANELRWWRNEGRKK